MFLLSNSEKGLRKLSDEDVLHQYCRTRAPEYFAELFNRYVPIVFSICKSYLDHDEDRRDMVMRIFQKCLEKVDQQPVKKFSGWLSLLARNECIDYLRLQEKAPEKALPVKNWESPENGYYHRQESLIRELSVALGSLKPHQRRCIELYYFEEKSYKEISRTTGFSDKEVKSYLQNGKRRLRILIERKKMKDSRLPESGKPGILPQPK